jgi:hypothetical protein
MVGDPIRAYHQVQTERAAAGLNMASATGIPASAVAARGQSEEEPLLGGTGDASQAEGQSLWYNLWIGECRSERGENGIDGGQVPHRLLRRGFGS